MLASISIVAWKELSRKNVADPAQAMLNTRNFALLFFYSKSKMCGVCDECLCIHTHTHTHTHTTLYHYYHSQPQPSPEVLDLSYLGKYMVRPPINLFVNTLPIGVAASCLPSGSTSPCCKRENRERQREGAGEGERRWRRERGGANEEKGSEGRERERKEGGGSSGRRVGRASGRESSQVPGVLRNVGM